MSDDFSEEKDRGSLIDEDPALDFILYEEMVKDERQPPRRQRSGCLGLILLFLLPAGALYLFLRILSA